MQKAGSSTYNRNMAYDTNNKRTQNIFTKSYEPFNSEEKSTAILIKNPPHTNQAQIPYYDPEHEKLTKTPSQYLQKYPFSQNKEVCAKRNCRCPKFHGPTTKVPKAERLDRTNPNITAIMNAQKLHLNPQTVLLVQESSNQIQSTLKDFSVIDDKVVKIKRERSPRASKSKSKSRKVTPKRKGNQSDRRYSHDAYRGVAYHTLGQKAQRIRSQKKSLKVDMVKSDLNAAKSALSDIAVRRAEKKKIMRMINDDQNEQRESKRFNPGSSFERKGPQKGGAPGHKIPQINSSSQLEIVASSQKKNKISKQSLNLMNLNQDSVLAISAIDSKAVMNDDLSVEDEGNCDDCVVERQNKNLQEQRELSKALLNESSNPEGLSKDAKGNQSEASLTSFQKRQQEQINKGIESIFEKEKRFIDAQETKRLAKINKQSPIVPKLALKTASDELSLDELTVPVPDTELIQNGQDNDEVSDDIKKRKMYQLNNDSSDSLLYKVPSSQKELMFVALQKTNNEDKRSTNYQDSKVSASIQNTKELLQNSLNMNESYEAPNPKAIYSNRNNMSIVSDRQTKYKQKRPKKKKLASNNQNVEYISRNQEIVAKSSSIQHMYKTSNQHETYQQAFDPGKNYETQYNSQLVTRSNEDQSQDYPHKTNSRISKKDQAYLNYIVRNGLTHGNDRSLGSSQRSGTGSIRSSKNSRGDNSTSFYLDRSHDVIRLSQKNKVGGTSYKKQKMAQIDDDYFNSGSSKVLLKRKTSDSAKYINTESNQTVLNLHNNYTDDIYSIGKGGKVSKIINSKANHQILPQIGLNNKLSSVNRSLQSQMVISKRQMNIPMVNNTLYSSGTSLSKFDESNNYMDLNTHTSQFGHQSGNYVNHQIVTRGQTQQKASRFLETQQKSRTANISGLSSSIKQQDILIQDNQSQFGSSFQSNDRREIPLKAKTPNLYGNQQRSQIYKQQSMNVNQNQQDPNYNQIQIYESSNGNSRTTPFDSQSASNKNEGGEYSQSDRKFIRKQKDFSQILNKQSRQQTSMTTQESKTKHPNAQFQFADKIKHISSQNNSAHSTLAHRAGSRNNENIYNEQTQTNKDTQQHRQQAKLASKLSNSQKDRKQHLKNFHEKRPEHDKKDPNSNKSTLQSNYMTRASQFQKSEETQQRIQEHNKAVQKIKSYQKKQSVLSTLSAKEQQTLKNINNTYTSEMQRPGNQANKKKKGNLLSKNMLSQSKSDSKSLETLDRNQISQSQRRRFKEQIELQNKLLAQLDKPIEPIEKCIAKKCNKCCKIMPSIKEESIKKNAIQKKRAIDASPTKKRGKNRNKKSEYQTLEDLNTINLSEGRHSVHHSKDRLSKSNSQDLIEGLTPVKQSKHKKSGEIDRKKRLKVARNLLRFLENNKSKNRLELGRAYNITEKQQREFFERNSPEKRFYRLYVVEKKNKKPETKALVDLSPMKRSNNITGINSLSPKAMRRQINGISQIYGGSKMRFGQEISSEQAKESRIQKLRDQIQKNTVEENYHLYHRDKDAKRIMDDDSSKCECSLDSRSRSLSRSKINNKSVSQKSSIDKTESRGISPLERKVWDPTHCCRRSCSTIHNPAFCGKGRRGRPGSADEKRMRGKVDIKKIDWFNSEINEFIHQTRFDQSVQIEPSTSQQKIKAKSHVSPFENFGNFEKEVEHNDMKHLFRLVDLNPSQQKKLNILSLKEVKHYYTMIKEQPLREQVFSSRKEQEQLIAKAQKTLRVIMISLMLSKEFDIINHSYEKKLEIKHPNRMTDQKIMEVKMEPLIKILLRCRQYYESKHEIVRILVKWKKRENLLNQFEEELDVMDADRARSFYNQCLNVSTRLYNQIERLRTDNPMMNRPFIYSNQNTQRLMIKQIINIRLNLKKRFEALRGSDELDQVLDKTGKVVSIEQLAILNKDSVSERSSHRTNASMQRMEANCQRQINLNTIKDNIDKESEIKSVMQYI